MFNKPLFKHTILFLVLAELFSLVSYVYPILNSAVFFVVLALVLVIAWQRMEWALYIVIAELLVGSFGQLFSVDFEGTVLSIRIGIFLVVLAVWFGKSVVSGLGSLVSLIKDFFATKIGRWYGLLAIVLLWGLGWGMIRNEFADVFLDFNNWLYFLYVLPFYDVFIKRHSFEQIQKNILTIVGASIMVLGFKTLILEWFFAHQILGTIEMLYRWIRDFRIGEITFYANNFYRVFLQGQVWLMLGFFMFLGLLWGEVKSDKFRLFKKKSQKSWLKVLLITTTVLLISFSRSLWLGWVAGLCVFGLLLLFKFRTKFSQIARWIGTIVGLYIVSFLVIVLVVTLPPVKEGGDLGSLLSDRVTVIEAAGSSRINLLKPLFMEIVEHPVIGSGFGSTVTYRSVDPRILGSTAGASGEYTTYAFEWAYLDIMLKVGLAGLVIYLGLLVVILKSLWQKINQPVMLGLFLALIALMVVNITTPYLNHPLGIGFIVLVTLWCLSPATTLQEQREGLE